MGKFKNKKLLKKISQISDTDKKFQKLEETSDILIAINVDEKDILPHFEDFKNFLKQKNINFTQVKFSIQKPPKEPAEDVFYIFKCKYWENNPDYKKISDKIFSISILFTKQYSLEALYFFKTFKAQMRVTPEFETNIADITFIIKDDFSLYIDAIKTYLTNQ